MEFDSFSIGLLLLRPDAPVLDAQAEDELQDAHMDHLAQLHEAGLLLAAGPLRPPDGGPNRGLSILRLEPQKAQEALERDPAVLAGRYSVLVLPWLVPAGAISFSPTRFPRSLAEARAS
ncbi:MAG: YciI family protein [Candidatus Dormibacteraeota bacterium]|uniref:YciI family protein n=1 Tax=Candidatus Dormibacter sp. TaxID=2973982 RepID=UPI0026CD2669|nr:YciI family protein [Candidatus Dormibacteraeota bacterium]